MAGAAPAPPPPPPPPTVAFDIHMNDRNNPSVSIQAQAEAWINHFAAYMDGIAADWAEEDPIVSAALDSTTKSATDVTNIKTRFKARFPGRMKEFEEDQVEKLRQMTQNEGETIESFHLRVESQLLIAGGQDRSTAANAPTLSRAEKSLLTAAIKAFVNGLRDDRLSEALLTHSDSSSLAAAKVAAINKKDNLRLLDEKRAKKGASEEALRQQVRALEASLAQYRMAPPPALAQNIPTYPQGVVPAPPANPTNPQARILGRPTMSRTSSLQGDT
ncbi:hypothetical protein TWF481_002859 [Arthrobotrys musiformis]|uniref:Retrotransposon gag domain-containing protein n=1 Tax=Arthrobotrys musiformis TaxID=47236 RepID=A0AAV9VT59_9PEZI